MIAVTGANGLLGSFIVRALLSREKKFVALKRPQSNTSLLSDITDKITWLDADVLHPVALDEALKNVTQVIHTAGFVSFNPRNRQKLFEINIDGTRNVVNACLVNGVQRLIHVSSVAALGRMKGQTRIDENNKWTETNLNSRYAESKYQAELEVFRGQEEGLSTVIINPSVILAPANWLNSSARVFKYVWDQRPFYIDGCFNFVDVRDVADITCQLLDDQVQGQRFIISAGNVTFSEFFSEVARRLNRKKPYLRVPERLLPAIAFAERIRSNIMGTEPLITRETARLAGNRFHYDSERISKKLNFNFLPIEQTLDWCCEYYIRKANAKK